jgi:hypothetical protein
VAKGTGDLIVKTIDTVVNGVSQQPPTVRASSQCEAQENMISKIVEGVARRPGTEWITILTSDATPTAGYKVHIRDRDEDIQHLVLVSDGAVRVWNLFTGVEATVVGPPMGGYVSELTGTTTDQTTEANQATANDMNLMPAATTTSRSYFGHEAPFSDLEINVSTIGVGTYTVTWEYWDGDSWEALTVTDGTTHFKTIGLNSVTFTPPTDWASKDDLDDLGIEDMFWIRAEYVSGTITTNPLGKQIHLGGGAAYLDTTGPDANENFAVMSVADYSFIINKETTVAKSTRIFPTVRPNEFMIYAFETTTSTDTDISAQIGSTTITDTDFNVTGTDPALPGEFIRTLLGTAGADPIYTNTNFSNWTFTMIGQTVIHGEQTGSTGTPEQVYPLSWEYSDETYSFLYKQTQKFSDLPSRAVNGFSIEITGDDGNEDNNYWVTFDEDLSAWIETVQPGLTNGLDATTMPHALIQTSTGGGASGEDTFTFGPLTWNDRSAGDENTAPDPSFVGQTLTDIVFHKNRLGLVAGENTILSETGEFFNFYPTTVATVVDSDPIDAAGTNNRIGLIDFAVPWDQKLYLFSGHGAIQNSLFAAGNATAGLTSANVQVVEASAYPSSSLVKPVPAGRSIYFAVDRGVATAIYDYQIIDGLADAADVTSHCPTYVPPNVFSMTISPKENILVCLSSDETHRLYVYSFFNNEQRKVQSSWSKWTFDADYDIVGVQWVGEILYMVVDKTDGLHLEKINTATLVDGDLDHRIHLDSLTAVTGVYTPSTLGYTEFTLPYACIPATYGETHIVLSASGWGDELGQLFPDAEYVATDKFRVPGDWSAYAVTVGRVFSHDYEFTKPLVTAPSGQQGTANIPVTAGRLQVAKFKLITRSSGGFEARVSSDEVNPDEVVATADEWVYEFPNKVISSGTVDAANPRPADQFTFDVGMEGRHARIRITGSSHLPCTIVGAEWEGTYVPRATRIT